MTMKTYLLQLKSLGIAAGLTLGAVMVLSMFAWTTASAAVALTKHNLGSAGPGPNTFSGTTEVCVFCHTPHGADVTAEVPLWNKTLAAPASYTTYDTLGTTSLDGATAPVGSVSIACLSCHDGTQAMDAVLNAPGSGLAGDATWQAGTWTGDPNPQGVANLGQNLTDDHPIGIQYGGGGITTGTPAAATNDDDFVQAGAGLGNTQANGRTVWWVDTEGTPNGTREKTDMQLYTRSVAAIDAGADQPFVECASCHDPHSDTPSLFLRVSNDGSAVCLACHVK
jgi:predicted CXXCH cytochrome family protein